MEMNELSIVITTFKSELKIFTCLDAIPSNIKTIVVENSNNESFKKDIEKKYKNVNCILTGENKGYARANNIGLSEVKTEFALVLNPDAILQKNAVENFFKITIKNDDFWASLIDQIIVHPLGELEIIPRIGAKVILGVSPQPDELRKKLLTFYRAQIRTGNLKNYSLIDLSYKNQVIAKRHVY